MAQSGSRVRPRSDRLPPARSTRFESRIRGRGGSATSWVTAVQLREAHQRLSNLSSGSHSAATASEGGETIRARVRSAEPLVVQLRRDLLDQLGHERHPARAQPLTPGEVAARVKLAAPEGHLRLLLDIARELPFRTAEQRANFVREAGAHLR